MSDPDSTRPPGYDALYTSFDSPIMQRLRQEAYGEDIGQHSWITAAELREGIALLQLSATSHLLDLGCGPGGPLTYVATTTGCHGHGMDVSAPAVVAGRARVEAAGCSARVTLDTGDLDEPLPFAARSFDAVISLDVVLHLRDRQAFFLEIARVLVEGGRLLFTDAGVTTGAISDDEVAERAAHGRTQLVPPGENERGLAAAGLRLLEHRDRTASLIENAVGRLSARRAHRAEVEALEGTEAFERQQRYLETVIKLSERGALSRFSYLAEARTIDAAR